MEQIKSSTENSEKILSAARKAYKSSSFSNEISEMNYYVKENPIAVDELKKQFNKLMNNKKEDHVIMTRGIK